MRKWEERLFGRAQLFYPQAHENFISPIEEKMGGGVSTHFHPSIVRCYCFFFPPKLLNDFFFKNKHENKFINYIFYYFILFLTK